jgi:hypothetical protein
MSHKNRRHGLSRTRIHNLWWAMITRCTNPNSHAFKDYGGRGIKVCDRWRTFENFYADMGERPDGKSLDRINNDGDYEPENCRWATHSEQHSNRRSCHRLEAFGRNLTLTEWSVTTGVPVGTLWARICKLGWPATKALSMPLRKDRRRAADDTIRLLTEALGADPEMLTQEAA